MKVRICSTCGQTETGVIPATGHAWSSWTIRTAATCTADGVKVRICTVCGDTEKQAIPAIGHTTEVIPGKAATCTESGLTEGKKCSVCGTVVVAQTTIPAKGHVEEIIPGKAATCTESGLTEGKRCSVCGTVIVAQTTIPARGHIEEVIPARAATCTESGLTEGKKCSVCGAVIVAQTVVPATGHQYISHVVAPTTTAQGYTKYTCTICHDTYKAGWTHKLASADTQPAEPDAQDIANGPYGSIVTTLNNTDVSYTASIVDNGVLVLTADPETDGTYSACTLHLQLELIAQLKEEGVQSIRFIVGDAVLDFPLDAFDNTDVELIIADMKQTITGYLVTIDPNAAPDQAYQVALSTSEDSKTEITSFLQGFQLTIGTEKIEDK